MGCFVIKCSPLNIYIMAFSLNRSQIIGNVTRDPEVRQTSSGQSVASFSVATNRVWKDRTTGDRQEQADFHNIVAWGKLAEIVSQYVKKGRKIYVEGRMQTRDWTGEDGVKRYRTEIVAENVILLDRAGAPVEGGAKFERTPNSAAVSSPAASAAPDATVGSKAAAAPVAADEVSIDDLPF